MVKLQFKSTISSIFLAIFCSNMDIICFICIWGHKLSSVNKNNYRKNNQTYTFLGYFRLPLWLFHKLKGDYQIFILMKYVRFMLNIKILMLITSNNTGKCTFGLKHHTNVAIFRTY